ncbi:MAG: hypothetical protein NC117_00270 [Pseudoflavonifractor sp.]|nr:hypothetical protein [Pseudoflavonifractor sp.]
MEKFLKKAWLLPVLFCAMISCFALTSCGDDDDEPGDASSLVGKWGMEGVLDGDYVTSTMDFHKNGTVTVEEKFRNYPEDNYKVTVNYTVEGDLSEGATLNMYGKDADGENYSQTYVATISGKTLTLIGVGGEADGECLALTKK